MIIIIIDGRQIFIFTSSWDDSAMRSMHHFASASFATSQPATAAAAALGLHHFILTNGHPATAASLRPLICNVVLWQAAPWDTMGSNISNDMLKCIYSNVGRFFCTPAPPKIYEKTCCGFFFQLWELI